MNIHPTAVIETGAQIGIGTSVGPFTIIHRNVILGSNCTVGSNCELGIETVNGDGSPLRIGEGACIRSHSVFYESSTFGPGLMTGHHVAAREKITAGRGFQLGSNSDVQGHCSIGDYVRTHRGVHIGKWSDIGSFVWLFPDVLLTNDPNPPSNDLQGPTIGDFAVIAARVTVLPGIRIGRHTFIGAQSLVGVDIPDFMMAAGSPAKILGKSSALRMKGNIREKAYPWNKRFHRGYPPDVVAHWVNDESLT